MHCDVYKFTKHDEMYVYIARPNFPDDTADPNALVDALSVLPKELRSSLGAGKFVMHLDLNETQKLARVNKDDVLEKLNEQGYFVQSPPADVLVRQAHNRVKEAQDKRHD